MKADFTPSFSKEKIFWDQGFSHVVGIDEVGRGCFAGPVVVAGVVFNPACLDFPWVTQIHDSKLLSQKTRETLAPLIRKHSIHFSIEEISVPIINEFGIGKATILGMKQVVKKLVRRIKHTNIAILADACTIPEIPYQQNAMIKGDQQSISIAAASIIAKVYRDDLMEQLTKKYQQYAFDENKGYGTKKHRDAIRLYGLSDIHRTSFDLRKYC